MVACDYPCIWPQVSGQSTSSQALHRKWRRITVKYSRSNLHRYVPFLLLVYFLDLSDPRSNVPLQWNGSSTIVIIILTASGSLLFFKCFIGLFNRFVGIFYRFCLRPPRIVVKWLCVRAIIGSKFC